MIVFFVGSPGSGKSYEAVKKIVDNLKMGRVVCTNIEGMDDQKCQEYLKNILDMDDFTFRQRFKFLDKEQVVKFWETEQIINLHYRHDADHDVFEDIETTTVENICPNGSLIVIDEVHKHFNARDWQKDSNRKLADWASTHRHLGYDLVFITQDIEKVDKQVRTLTEWCYFFRKVNFFGGAVKNKYLSYSYAGDDHNGKPLAKNTRTYESVYFPCYKSYSSSDAKEVGFMTHTNILKHPVFYAIPLVIVFCLYMVFNKSSFASGDVFGTSKVQNRFNQPTDKKTKPPENIAAPPPLPIKPLVPAKSEVAAQAAPSMLPEMPKGSFNTVYHVDGYILDNGKTIISINGRSVKLPSPDVLKFNKNNMTVVADASVFGSEGRSKAFSSAPALPTMPPQ